MPRDFAQEIPYTDEASGEEKPMQTDEKVSAGLDVMWRMRVPADLIPRVQSYARRRGLSASAFIRLVVIDALDAAEVAEDMQKAA